MAKPQTTIRVADDPQFQAALKPVADLKAKQREIKAIVDRLQRETSPEDFQSAIAAIVAGADPVGASAQLDDSKALAAARNSLTLLAHAIDRAQAAAEAQHTAAQARYIASARPRYLEITRRLANALLEIGDAQTAALEFSHQLLNAGAEWPDVEGPIGVFDLGDPRDEFSTFGKWLVAAVRAGALDADFVSKAWTTERSLLYALRRGGELTDGEAVGFAALRARVGAPTPRLGAWRKRA